MRVITDRPFEIQAVILDSEVLVVRRSTIVHDESAQMRPVNEVLKGCCHSIKSDAVAPSKEFMFGEARATTVQLYAVCPGSSCAHECREDIERSAA